LNEKNRRDFRVRFFSFRTRVGYKRYAIYAVPPSSVCLLDRALRSRRAANVFIRSTLLARRNLRGEIQRGCGGVAIGARFFVIVRKPRRKRETRADPDNVRRFRVGQ